MSSSTYVEIALIYLVFLLFIYYATKKERKNRIIKKPIRTKGIVKKINKGISSSFIYTVKLIDSNQTVNSIEYYMKYNSTVLKVGDEVDVDVYPTSHGSICKIIYDGMIPIHNQLFSTFWIMFLLLTFVVLPIIIYYFNTYDIKLIKKLVIIVAVPIVLIRLLYILLFTNIVYKFGRITTAKLIKKEAIVYNNNDGENRRQDRIYVEVQLKDGHILKNSLLPVESSMIQDIKLDDEIEIIVLGKSFLLKEFTDNYIKEKKKKR